MDRENALAKGWSHVLSTTDDLDELERFRLRVGAPRQALHLGNRRRPHLDLKLEPRERALADPEVLVFERTSDMLRFLKSRGDPGTAGPLRLEPESPGSAAAAAKARRDDAGSSS